LVFDGLGTIILTNFQNYSGGTTIASGTLIERNQLLAGGL
jgi:autotransporter-associated beta strand protein